MTNQIRLLACILWLSVSLGVVACSTPIIVLTEDAEVTVPGGVATHKKSGAELSLSSGPVLLESPGKISLLIVPTNASSGVIQPKLKSIDKFIMNSKETQSEINATLTNLIVRINEVQKLISARKAQEALAKVESLKTDYPEILYLNVYMAGSLYLLGRKKEAKDVMEPIKNMDDETKRFYKSLD